MTIVYTGRRNRPSSASYASGADNTARRSQDYQLGVMDGDPLIEPLPRCKPGAKYAVLASIAVV